MALHPLVINIGSIDEIASVVKVSIHDGVRLALIGVTTKDVAAKAQRMNYEVGFGNSNHARTVRHNWAMSETTGGFASEGLALEARTLLLPSLTQAEAIEIGEIAKGIGMDRALPIAVEVRLKEWIVFHASLPGSTPDNDAWIARKARVTMATGNSTMFERVLAEEQGINWYEVNGLPEETHAIHGGSLPLNVKGLGFSGILLISGLPQVQDHLLGVEVIAEFLARKGELS